MHKIDVLSSATMFNHFFKSFILLCVCSFTASRNRCFCSLLITITTIIIIRYFIWCKRKKKNYTDSCTHTDLKQWQYFRDTFCCHSFVWNVYGIHSPNKHINFHFCCLPFSTNIGENTRSHMREREKTAPRHGGSNDNSAKRKRM